MCEGTGYNAHPLEASVLCGGRGFRIHFSCAAASSHGEASKLGRIFTGFHGTRVAGQQQHQSRFPPSKNLGSVKHTLTEMSDSITRRRNPLQLFLEGLQVSGKLVHMSLN